MMTRYTFSSKCGVTTHKTILLWNTKVHYHDHKIPSTGLQISEFHSSCKFNVKDFKNLIKRMQSLIPYRHCPHISAMSTFQFQHEALSHSFTNFIPEVISISSTIGTSFRHSRQQFIKNITDNML